MIDIIQKIESFLQITDNGYVEHFIAGLVVSVFVTYLTLKKTNNYWIALSIGIIVTTLIGLSKELIDPYMRGDRDKLDLILTVLGGTIGGFIILLIKKSK